MEGEVCLYINTKEVLTKLEVNKTRSTICEVLAVYFLIKFDEHLDAIVRT